MRSNLPRGAVVYLTAHQTDEQCRLSPDQLFGADQEGDCRVLVVITGYLYATT